MLVRGNQVVNDRRKGVNRTNKQNMYSYNLLNFCYRFKKRAHGEREGIKRCAGPTRRCTTRNAFYATLSFDIAKIIYNMTLRSVIKKNVDNASY